jgi:hypothetical protein
MAMTELVIIAPIFIMIILWSQFFVDFGVVKLKVLEATRYALWELVAQQPTATIRADIERRFADLSSPAALNAARPVNTEVFATIAVSQLTLNDRIPATLSGNIARSPPGGGLLNQILGGLRNFLGQTADWVLRQYRFNQQGAAEATVEFSATLRNGFFPSGQILGILLRPDANQVPTTIRTSLRSPRMLVDVWKAWPGKYNADVGQGNIETAPSATYPTGSASSAPEKIVASRVRNAAFFGQGGTISSVTQYLTYVGLPNPVNLDTWAGDRNRRDKDGPIMMLPGATPRNSFSPGASAGLQRYGERRTSSSGVQTVRDDSSSGKDRYRYTTPSVMSTALWNNSSALDGATTSSARAGVAGRNPYQLMYQCRDAFYMGGRNSEISRYRAASTRAYLTRAFPGCTRQGY